MEEFKTVLLETLKQQDEQQRNYKQRLEKLLAKQQKMLKMKIQAIFSTGRYLKCDCWI